MHIKYIVSPISIMALIACSTQQETIREEKPFGLSNVEQLTFEGDNGEAYWGPDGKQIIFQSKRDGHGCDKIYIMNADGSNQHIVSPDGKFMAFASNRDAENPRATHIFKAEWND